jgi:hypothetical protein
MHFKSNVDIVNVEGNGPRRYLTCASRSSAERHISVVLHTIRTRRHVKTVLCFVLRMLQYIRQLYDNMVTMIATTVVRPVRVDRNKHCCVER